MISTHPTASGRRIPLRAGASLEPAEFARLRRTCVMEHCKWDPQVGDQTTLAPFPVFISEADWAEVAECAKALGAEVLAAESELLYRTDLHHRLGLPAALRREFARSPRVLETPSFARTMRFDFHFTADGWRVSEVNSDVPGGFSEAEGFAGLMARHFTAARMPGYPASSWAKSVASVLPNGGGVALLSTPGYMEDAQVVAYLAQFLRARGFSTRLIGPSELRWAAGRAFLDGRPDPLAAIVRFYQLEWLTRLPAAGRWPLLLFDGVTPVCNAGRAGLSESKRFPLVCHELRAKLPTFSRLSPEVRDPRDAAFARPDSWVLKASFSNCGDAVIARDWVSRSSWQGAWARALLNPNGWVAQRKFDALRLDTTLGPLTHCLGVYVIDGDVAGAYLRLSRERFVGYTAMDAALLVVKDE